MDDLHSFCYYYYYHYYCLLFEAFLHQRWLVAFHGSLSDSKSYQVSRTLLSILADLNNVVVWMVTTRPLISMSSSLFNNPLVTVQRAPIIIGINVTFMFYSFSISKQGLGTYPPLFLSILLWGQPGQLSPQFYMYSFFFFLLIIIRSGRLAEIIWSICMLKSHQSLCVYSPGQLLGCAYTICSYGQT